MLLPEMTLIDPERTVDRLIQQVFEERKRGEENQLETSPLALIHYPDEGGRRRYELKRGAAIAVEIDREYTGKKTILRIARLLGLAPDRELLIYDAHKLPRLIPADFGFCVELYRTINTYFTPEWRYLPLQPRHLQGSLSTEQLEELNKYIQAFEQLESRARIDEKLTLPRRYYEALQPFSIPEVIISKQSAQTKRRESTQERDAVIKSIKDKDPTLSVVRVAEKASKQLGEEIKEHDVRNAYKRNKWNWQRADRVR